jgi:hypothetical protein
MPTGNQPVNDSMHLFCTAFAIQSNQVLEYKFIGKILRPAVGSKHCLVEFIVKLAKYAHKSLLVYFVLLLGE